MRCYTLVALATVLLMSGCSLFAGNDDAPAPVVQPAETQPGPEQVVRPKLRSTRVAAALIRPTNPDERLRVMRSGRPDPFAALRSPGQPSTSASASDGPGANSSAGSRGSDGTGAAGAANSKTNNTITVRTSGRGSGSSGASGATGSASSPIVVRRPLPSRPELSPSGNRSSSSPQPSPSLPPLPQPELAKGVQVSGIALVNGLPRAIIKAPNESVARSVGPGDSLSNGQILVKRIDTSNRAEPVVILEQYGTEVAVGVGKPAVQLASASTGLSAPGNLPPVPALWYDKQNK